MGREIQYRTFEQLLSAVLSDFKSYDLEGLIDPQDLIKVAQRINKELSVKIHQDREAILEVEKGRVRLPNDFYMLNHAMVCGSYTVSVPVITGHQTEDVILGNNCIPSTCTRPTVRLTECGEAYQVVQHFSHETRTFKYFHKLHIKPGKELAPQCQNVNTQAERSAYIKDGWLYCNFETATVYISYVGNMEDEDGNLLVLDHDIVNEYYEYALKERILENMWIAGEEVERQMALISSRRGKARIEARSVVFTPDFAELQNIHAMNRKYMYNKYYKMFETVNYI